MASGRKTASVPAKSFECVRSKAVAALFWDASGLAKRFVPEPGSDSVNALFATTPRLVMVGTIIGYAETFSILLRHRNRGGISAATFAGATSLLRVDVAENPEFSLLTVDDGAFFGRLKLIEQYNLNATDAAILA